MMKKKLKKLLKFAFLLPIILLSEAFAQNGHNSHVHGTSNITIALDNNVLQIQLKTPLMDIAGFEGKPKTQLQKQTLKKVSNELKNWENIFKFPVGSCSNKRVTVLDKHIKEHDHKHKNHNNEEKNLHSEIKVLYEFSCTKPNNFKSLEIGLFKIFPGIKKLNAQWTTFNGQGQKVLNARQNVLTIR